MCIRDSTTTGTRPLEEGWPKAIRNRSGRVGGGFGRGHRAAPFGRRHSSVPPEFGGQGRRKGGDILGRGCLRSTDEERIRERRVVRDGPGQRQPGQNTAVEK